MRSGTKFKRVLAGRRRVWQAGLAVCWGLRTTAVACFLLTLFGLLDLLLAFSPAARIALDAAILALLVILFGTGIVRTILFSLHDMAMRIDTIHRDRRGRVLSACELADTRAGGDDEESSLAAYLLGRCLEEAGEQVRATPLFEVLPRGRMWRELRLAGCAAALLILLASLSPLTALGLARRIATPWQDHPPVSRYVFDVRPPVPRAVYGGDLEVSATITGAPVESQVWFITRYGGKTHRTPCFQETVSRFAQRLESLVSPVEFCFATGKARSHWRRVELLLQPKVVLASASVIPPPYAGLPERRFYIGVEPLSGLRQSKVEVTVTSNRPLLDGQAGIRGRGGLAEPVAVAGTASGTHAVTFRWLLTEDADIDIVVRDVRGTPSDPPFRITQSLIPDRPPSVNLDQPSAFSLATPGILMPVEAHIEDDIGLRRAELIRTVVGFRDRIRPLYLDPVSRSLDVNEHIDLSLLGVEPGQVLEFYAEARDSNPDLTGIAASELARVQIISEEEYGVMLRAKITLQEFLRKYQAARDALDEVRRAFQDMATMPDSEDGDARRAQALEATRHAAEFFHRLARDFSAFDVEKGLSGVLSTAAVALDQVEARLEQAPAGVAGLRALAADVVDLLGAPAEALTEQLEQAEQIAEVASLMETAVRFRLLVRRQAALVRSLSRYATESSTDSARRLLALGVRQSEILDELTALSEAIPRQARELPPPYGSLRESALHFVALLADADVPAPMREAVVAAQNSDGRKTHHAAQLALERLEGLLKATGDEPFGGVVFGQGGLPSFGVTGDVQATLEQMLAALAMRLLGFEPGSSGGSPMPGEAGGTGLGLIGDSNDGFWMGGFTPLNIPVFGPIRMRFDAATGGAFGDSGSGGARSAPVSGVSRTEVLESDRREETDSKGMRLDEIPEKYREAIKRYFAEEP